MSKFILGLACGIGLTLLTPWGRNSPLLDSFKDPTPAPKREPAPTPAPDRDWMFDKHRGTLNVPPRATH